MLAGEGAGGSGQVFESLAIRGLAATFRSPESKDAKAAMVDRRRLRRRLSSLACRLGRSASACQRVRWPWICPVDLGSVIPKMCCRASDFWRATLEASFDLTCGKKVTTAVPAMCSWQYASVGGASRTLMEQGTNRLSGNLTLRRVGAEEAEVAEQARGRRTIGQPRERSMHQCSMQGKASSVQQREHIHPTKRNRPVPTRIPLHLPSSSTHQSGGTLSRPRYG